MKRSCIDCMLLKSKFLAGNVSEHSKNIWNKVKRQSQNMHLGCCSLFKRYVWPIEYNMMKQRIIVVKGNFLHYVWGNQFISFPIEYLCWLFKDKCYDSPSLSLSLFLPLSVWMNMYTTTSFVIVDNNMNELINENTDIRSTYKLLLETGKKLVNWNSLHWFYKSSIFNNWCFQFLFELHWIYWISPL